MTGLQTACAGFCVEFASRMKSQHIKNNRKNFCSHCVKYVHQCMVFQYRCKCCGNKIRTEPEPKVRDGHKGVGVGAGEGQGEGQAQAQAQVAGKHTHIGRKAKNGDMAVGGYLA